MFVVTDILTNDSVGLAIGNAANVVEKAYNVSLENNTATLKGVVSRKTNRTSINRSIPSLILLSTDRKGQVVGLATCLFYLQKTEDSIFNRGLCMLNEFESKLQSLLERNITSVLELESWLFDELCVTAEVEEEITSSLIATYRDTDDRNMRDLHMYNQNTIQPLLKDTLQNLTRNLESVRFSTY